MPLTVTTDHAAIRTVVDRFVAADPVLGTLLATIGATLEDSAWAAHDATRLAVRSTDFYPVAVAGEWDRADLPELAPLLAALPGIRGVSGRVEIVETLLELLAPIRVGLRMEQRLFRLDALTEPQGVGGHGVIASDQHRLLVRAWFAEFMAEAEAFGHRDDHYADLIVATGMCWLWLDTACEPVSLAARRPAIGGSARVGPVYTPPAARGHGYGSAVTAAATRSILAERAIPVLFTNLANPTSNKIYQALGYRQVEDRQVVSFS
jgi:GNAT superfamily N-acetyltransferase